MTTVCAKSSPILLAIHHLSGYPSVIIQLQVFATQGWLPVIFADSISHYPHSVGTKIHGKYDIHPYKYHSPNINNGVLFKLYKVLVYITCCCVHFHGKQQSKMRFFGTPLKAKMTLENPPCSIQKYIFKVVDFPMTSSLVFGWIFRKLPSFFSASLTVFSR